MARAARTAAEESGAPRKQARKPKRPDVLESHDPATGELIGTVPVTPPNEVAKIAEEVSRVQEGWALTPVTERARVIGRAARVLIRRNEELSSLITRENGKTIVESGIVDVGNSIVTLDWLAKWAHRYLAPERIPDPQPFIKHKRHWIVYRPLGVVGIIGPWNYPLIIPIGEVAFALVAGNGVLLKPSEHTPLVAEQLPGIFAEAGLPDGLLRVVHGLGDTGAALCEAPPVKKVFFTGSTATGIKVMQTAAKHGKPAMLELGGKDPAIVCADADLDRAVAGTMWAGFVNSGHTCAAVERVYVDRRVYGEFVSRLVERTSRMEPGDPQDPDTQIGAISNDMQYEKIVDQLDDAKKRGATFECGGPVEVPGFPGKFIAPVVLTGVDHTMKVMTEETFGPILPVMPFDSEQEAIELANDSPYGLGASVWSRDRKRARILAERIDAGMVWVNDHVYSHGFGQAPWGGVKASGYGVNRSKFGLYEMVSKRLLSEDSGRMPVGWWYPYNEVKQRGFRALLEALYVPGARRRLRTLLERRDDLGAFFRQIFGRR